MPSLHVSEHAAQLCELFEKVFVDKDEARVRHDMGEDNMGGVLQYKYKSDFNRISNMEHLWEILIHDPELSHRNETSKIDDPSTTLHDVDRGYNSSEKTINPDINFMDFVSFLKFGIIPRLSLIHI